MANKFLNREPLIAYAGYHTDWIPQVQNKACYTQVNEKSRRAGVRPNELSGLKENECCHLQLL